MELKATRMRFDNGRAALSAGVSSAAFTLKLGGKVRAFFSGMVVLWVMPPLGLFWAR